MAYPNFEGKHAQEAFFSPSDYVSFLRRRGYVGEWRAPESVVLCYQRALLRHVLETEETEPAPVRVGNELHLLASTGNRVGIVYFGIGAPVAATVVEELIAHGARRFVNVGTAGSLQRSCRVGDVVLCDRAVRDEGVSHHYLPPGLYAEPSAPLTAALGQALDRAGVAHSVGPSWTIDTPYRETVAEARHYQGVGVLTVEMEAAAVFAVARYRQVDAAAAFVISDTLAELVWDPQFDSEETTGGLRRVFAAAADALQ